MRQDYQEFVARDAEVLALGPDGPRAFRRYWAEQEIPFPGLADLRNQVADTFGQEVNWLKFGRMPALLVIDKAGQIRYVHYGQSMQDIPANQEVWSVLDDLQREASQAQPSDTDGGVDSPDPAAIGRATKGGPLS